MKNVESHIQLAPLSSVAPSMTERHNSVSNDLCTELKHSKSYLRLEEEAFRPSEPNVGLKQQIGGRAGRMNDGGKPPAKFENIPI